MKIRLKAEIISHFYSCPIEYVVSQIKTKFFLHVDKNKLERKQEQ